MSWELQRSSFRAVPSRSPLGVAHEICSCLPCAHPPALLTVKDWCTNLKTLINYACFPSFSTRIFSYYCSSAELLGWLIYLCCRWSFRGCRCWFIFWGKKTLVFLSWLGFFYWKIYAWASGRSWQDWKTEGPDSLAGKDSKSCWPHEGNLVPLLRKFRHQTIYSASLSCKTDLEFELKFIFSDLTPFVIWQTHKDQIWLTSFFFPLFFLLFF